MPQRESTPGAPIYLQVADEIRLRIASGSWRPGMYLSPVHELSREFGANPNTTCRALFDLLQQGLLEAEQDSGYYRVTALDDRIARLRWEIAGEYARQYYSGMRALSCTPHEMHLYLDNACGFSEKGDGAAAPNGESGA